MRKRERKCSLPGRIAGDIILLFTALLTADVIIVMSRKIQTVVLKDIYRMFFIQEILILAVLLLFALDLRFGIFSSKKAGPLSLLGWLFRTAVISVTCICLLCFSKVLGGCVMNTAAEADRVIVLGMALENGQPPKDLVHRVETAEKYLLEHPSASLVLTGGNPDETGRTEAAVMRDLLLEMGVPEESLILEDKAASTVENFRNCLEMVDPEEPVVLVSSNYHMDRAVRTAHMAGFRNVLRLPAPSDPLTFGSNVMWEMKSELKSYR